jgi:hypothetical protein
MNSNLLLARYLILKPVEGGEFYKNYAHAAGFSVRKSTETKDKDGVR